jgi:hypothetical protein
MSRRWSEVRESEWRWRKGLYGSDWEWWGGGQFECNEKEWQWDGAASSDLLAAAAASIREFAIFVFEGRIRDWERENLVYTKKDKEKEKIKVETWDWAVSV